MEQKESKTMLGANMLLHSSTWGKEKTFRMLPVTLDCPYAECIYDPDAKALAVISKIAKQSFHMVAKLDDNGDTMAVKGKPRPSGKTYKEERKALDSYQEYYIEEVGEIVSFISMFAVNHGTFNLAPYIKELGLKGDQKTEVAPVSST